eukprot:TRINITY_DN11386_c0_g1_i1.p1 TRINITY_DN11386_c0_g1~~TRINITY_DN11386_c0_g1_i1.p1  ORF type:complete len:571 (+),score=200.37 TRINITY_DN11386_c0_g1_i1:90-1715(+)
MQPRHGGRLAPHASLSPAVVIALLVAWMFLITVWMMYSLGGERPYRGASPPPDASRELRDAAQVLRSEQKELDRLRLAVEQGLRAHHSADGSGSGDQSPPSGQADAQLQQRVHELEEKLEDCDRRRRRGADAEPRRGAGTDAAPDRAAPTPRPPPPRRRIPPPDPPPPKGRRPPRRGGDPARRSKGGRGIDGTGMRDELEKDPEGTIAVVVFTYSRDDSLKRCLGRIFEVLGGDEGFRVFVSQDGSDHPRVGQVADEFSARGAVHLVHERNDSGATPHEQRMRFQQYYAIAHHYGWAMREIFSVSVYRRLIILEEDIEVAGDFFKYMQAASPLLDADDSVWCISAWNDNGKAELVQSREQLYRTDFFPGLGWMLRRELWEELAPIWPAGFWDDWLRQPRHRKGRACIRPEVPRSFMWCDLKGASRGMFCREYLSRMKLDDVPVDWSSALDLEVYKKDNYDRWFDDLVSDATTVRSVDEISGDGQEYKIYYTTNREFSRLAHEFGLMPDFKDNVPRTAYKGVVTFRWQGSRVHLVSRISLYE